jgi:hypothetical protein
MVDFASDEVAQLVSDKMAKDSAEDITAFFVLNPQDMITRFFVDEI